MRQLTYAEIRDEMDNESWTMQLADKDEVRAVIEAVNQGIDSHLEACYCPSRGDHYGPHDTTIGDPPKLLCRKLACEVSMESFPVLLRRLWEMGQQGDNAAEELVSVILEVLGFSEAAFEFGDFEIIAPGDEPADAFQPIDTEV